MQSILLFAISILGMPTAHAARTSRHLIPDGFIVSCDDLISKASPPPKFLRPAAVEPWPEESPRTGYRMPNGWKPDRLNETYTFLLNDKNEFWITPELLGPPDANGKYIGTHRSLLAQMGEGHKIYAAGEIVVKNGVIVSISNKAGTFQRANNADNLRYAANQLRAQGVDFGGGVVGQDFSKRPRLDPKEEHGQRRDHLKRITQPKFFAVRSQWEQIMKQLYDRYPDPQNPGKVANLVEPFSEKFGAFHPEYDMITSVLAVDMFNESIDYLTAISMQNLDRHARIVRSLEAFLKETP